MTGVVRGTNDPTPELVNDLDLRVVDAAGHAIVGNDALHPGQPDRLNNVEVVSIANPPAGNYTVSVSANRIGSGTRQSFALVISGDADMSTPPSIARMIAAEIPGSELTVVPESGHSVYWEQPEIFNQAILDFMGKH